MKKFRKKLTIVAIVEIVCGALCSTFYFRTKIKVKTNLAQLSYENSESVMKDVYIKEYISSSEYKYVPYTIATDDYNGKALLLRKNVVSSKGTPINEGDTLFIHKYGRNASAYYKDSYMDKYLNTEYISRFSDYVKKNIAETNIEITNDNDNKEIEVMSAKVFLLSLYEYNVASIEGCLKEGIRLEYFNVKNRKVIADDNKKEVPYWTRTRDKYDDKIGYVISSVGGCGYLLAGEYDCVRPAFCMDGNTKIKLSNDVISGKKVYVLEGDE